MELELCSVDVDPTQLLTYSNVMRTLSDIDAFTFF